MDTTENEAMSDIVDQKATAANAADPVMKLEMCKVRDVTHVTVMGDADPLMAGFGTSDPDFFFGLLHHVANAGANGRLPDETGVKFMLAFIRRVRPRDEIEAALLAQAAAASSAAIRFMYRLEHAESLQEQELAERAVNKLMRTFAALVEAFQRYRSQESASPTGTRTLPSKERRTPVAAMDKTGRAPVRLLREEP
jgi:hypothetical protein